MFETDNESVKQVENKLINAILKILPESLDTRQVLAETILTNCCQYNPPEIITIGYRPSANADSTTHKIELMRAETDILQGIERPTRIISRKPANIALNHEGILRLLVDGTLTVTGISVPSLLPFAVASLCLTLWDLAEIDLSTNQSTVIFVLYVNFSERANVDEDELLGTVIRFQESIGGNDFDEALLAKTLNELHKLQCISLDGGKITMKEPLKKV